MTEWLSLSPCPDLDAHYASPSPLVLSDDELLLVPDTNNSHAMYKYNIKNNEWFEWFKYPNSLQSSYHTAALNKSKTLLYIYNEEGRVIEIDLKTQTFKVSTNKYHDGSCIASKCIDGEFNVFGGWDLDKKSHFVWNKEKQILMEIHKFNEIVSYQYDELHFHSALYVSSKKAVLIIPVHSHSIYLYSLINNQCNALSVYLQHPISCDCAVITGNGKYVLLFGTTLDPFTDIIQIIDLTAMKTWVSHIRCPIKRTFKAVIRNDHYTEELLTSGYIRECWDLPSFSNIQYLPFYMIKLIQSWFIQEIVHLLDRGESSDTAQPFHWQIPVDIITTL